ncbi:hypothetical protein ACFQX7_14445 [Luedemannella flava]
MNPRMIGGEMVSWSDLDGIRAPGPAGGAAPARLIGAAGVAGRVLVAGPHDPTLIDALPAGNVTVLVRGVPDAEALTARFAERPDVTVCCGGLEKLGAEPAFDAVVALDGVGRLSSVEGAELTWGEAFDQLVAALAPGGRLLFGMANPVGAHRLVALPAEPTDADWDHPGEYDLSRPAGLARVLARLAEAGLDVDRTYAAYPSPAAPAVLLGDAILADGAVSGYLAAALSRSFAASAARGDGVAAAQAGGPTGWVLTDPGRLARRAVRHGLAAELAPGWVFAARRAGGDAAGELPEAVVDGRRIDRDPVRGWVGDGGACVPPGRTLEDLLIGAAVRREMGEARTLLARWQGGAAAGVAADQVIVGPDGGLVAAGPADAAALRAFAVTLVRLGLARRWAPGGADEVAATLAAMADRDPAGGDSRDRLFDDREPDGGRPPDARAFDELIAERDALARELAGAVAKARWYERTLTEREAALNRARRVADLLATAGPARAGAAFVGGARLARRSARAILRRVRPRV